MEPVHRQQGVIINSTLKILIMTENTKKQNRGNENRSENEETDRMGTRSGNDSSGQNISNSKDERSSSIGRNVKNTGISTKDGLTGSDYDGQVTDGR
jgi:hypothetical protein